MPTKADAAQQRFSMTKTLHPPCFSFPCHKWIQAPSSVMAIDVVSSRHRKQQSLCHSFRCCLLSSFIFQISLPQADPGTFLDNPCDLQLLRLPAPFRLVTTDDAPTRKGRCTIFHSFFSLFGELYL